MMTTGAKVLSMVLIILCAKGYESMKAQKQETIYSIFFYRVLFGFLDFFFNIAFNPLGISFFSFLTNVLFISAYITIYIPEVTADSKECDTGSSTGPRLLKNHPLIQFVRICASNSDTRRIGGFLLVNMMFMFIEIIYGYLTNSLGLISDAAHMAFDCIALLIGLIASYISKM